MRMEHAANRFPKTAQDQTKQNKIEKKENPVLYSLYTEWSISPLPLSVNHKARGID
jgi:hypothetical protein